MITPGLRNGWLDWTVSILQTAKRAGKPVTGAMIADRMEKLAELANHEQDLRWLLNSGYKYARERGTTLPEEPALPWMERLRIHSLPIAQRAARELYDRDVKRQNAIKPAKVARMFYIPIRSLQWLEEYAPPDSRGAQATAGLERLIREQRAREDAILDGPEPDAKDPFD